MEDPKRQIRFILCGTRFAANLGRAARVMKNMGFERLTLVQPECEVGVEARTGAMRGDAILDTADFRPTLRAAAEDVDLLVGTTARLSTSHPRRIALRVFAEELLPAYLPSRVGVAFGNEGNGLDKEETDLCQWLVEIPTGSDYSSLNLSQAVAIVAYQTHLALSDKDDGAFLHLAARDEVAGLLDHLSATLKAIQPPSSLDLAEAMRRLSRIAARARLEKEDVNLIRKLFQLVQDSGDDSNR